MESLRQSFVKLNPRVMIKNPIMFTVEVVTAIMLVVCLLSLTTPEYGTFGYNFLVFIVLFATLLFANFAEAIAEVEAKFAGEGRVLIRPSGTEPLVRVMIEGKDQQLIESEAQKLAELISSIML